MESQKDFFSIDDNPVASRSIDTNIARRNLQELQDHVNQQFSNVFHTSPGAVRMMGSNTGQFFSHSGLDLIQRPPSIRDEDDLFRGESDGEESEEHDNVNSNHMSYKNSKRKMTDNGFGSQSVENEIGINIPKFDQLGLEKLSSDSETAVHQWDRSKTIEDNKELVKEGINEGNESGVREKTDKDFDVGVQYRSKRSQSDVREKRKRFSQQDNTPIDDIPVFEEESQAPVRKSNSLPDLILSLCSSSSLSRTISDRQVSPDVVFIDSQDDDCTDSQRNRKTLKDSIEGKSSFQKSDRNATDMKKALYRRSVSFNEKAHYRYFDEHQPAESPGVVESIETSFEDDDSVLSMQAQDTERSPKSTVERRQIFSKSSGYQTGSDHSHESHDTHNESFEKTGTENKAIGEKNYTKSDIEDFNSDTGHSSSTNETIIESIIKDSEKHGSNLGSGSLETQTEKYGEKTSCENFSPELPFLSIMEKSPQSSLNSYRVDKESLVDKSGTTATATDSIGSRQEHLRMNTFAHDFRRLQSTLSQPGSFGNLPKLEILDDSVVMGSSLFDKVEAEDKKQLDHVIKKYVGARGTVNIGGSLAHSGPSLGSDQPPTTIMMQEFEEILKKDFDLERLAAAVRKLLDSPGHSPADYGDSQHGSAAEKNKFFTVEELERASRCSDSKCKDKACEKLRQFSLLLELDVMDITTNLMLTHFLAALYQHSETCEEIMCPVLYCQKCLDWCRDGFDPNLLHKEIKAHLKNPLSYLEQTTEPKFVKFKDDVSDTVPEQFITYIPLSLLPGPGQMLLIQDLQKHSLNVLRQYPLFEDNHQISTLRALRNIEHPHIVPPLWMLEFTDTIHICSQFMQGGSLKEYLQVKESLSWLQAAIFLQQITDAVCFLQEKRVIYLSWQSDNMLFVDSRREVIKISDFGVSYCLDADPDIGAMKQCLPFYLCPPELLNNKPLCERSDCWGIGCLLAEMLTGTPVWYDIRHDDKETAYKKISNVIPDVDISHKDQEIIFQNCLKLDPDQRCTVQELKKFLKTVLSRREDWEIT